MERAVRAETPNARNQAAACKNGPQTAIKISASETGTDPKTLFAATGQSVA